MPDKDHVYAGQMLDMARKAVEKVRGLDRREFDGDENLRMALTHLIQIIGEAARKISDEFRAAHPEIPWKGIVGMRHKVVHDYMSVDEDVVWQTATEELEPLLKQLEEALGE